MSKRSKFCTFRTIRFGSNLASMWSKCVSNNVWRDFRLPVSSFAMVAQESFNGKFTTKIGFPIGNFMLLLLTLTLEVWSLDLHTLFDKYLHHMLVKFEQNCIVQNIQNFELFGKILRKGFGRRFCDKNRRSMLKY